MLTLGLLAVTEAPYGCSGIEVLISSRVEAGQSKGAACVSEMLARCHGRNRHQFGWLVSNAGEAAAHRILGALVAVVVVTLSGFAVHRRIERLIEALEDL